MAGIFPDSLGNSSGGLFAGFDLIDPARRAELFSLGKSLLGWTPTQSPLDPMPQTEMPPNAQFAMGQVPPPGQSPIAGMPQSGPSGMGDRLLAGLLGFGNSGALFPAIANAIGGLATGQRTDPHGVRERQAEGGNTDDIKEYNFARMQGYKGSLLDWIAAKRAGAGEYGLQAIWGTDAQGNPAIAQLGKTGTAIQSKLPEGFKPGKDAQKVDLGTHWGILDPTTRQMVTTIPKDIKGKESQEAEGKAEGEAKVALPTIVSNGERMLTQIEEVQRHPGRPSATGPFLGRVPGLAGAQLDFVERMDQLKGQSFLQAYQSLKGGGAITEVEGKKGEQAIARLSRAKDAKDIDSALNDLKEVVRTGVENARKKAGISSPAKPDASGLKKKYGLE